MLCAVMFGPYLSTRLFSARVVIKGRLRGPPLLGRDETRRFVSALSWGGRAGGTNETTACTPSPFTVYCNRLGYEKSNRDVRLYQPSIVPW